MNLAPKIGERDFGRKLIKIGILRFRKVPIGSDGLSLVRQALIVPAKTWALYPHQTLWNALETNPGSSELRGARQIIPRPAGRQAAAAPHASASAPSSAVARLQHHQTNLAIHLPHGNATIRAEEFRALRPVVSATQGIEH